MFSGIFLVVNALTVVVGVGVLVWLSPWLGLVIAVMAGPLTVTDTGAGAPLLARRPPVPGPGGRPRHRRRGVGARHPGAEVAGPRASPHGPVRRRRPRPARHGAHKVRLLAALWTVVVLVPEVRDRRHPRPGRLRRRRRHAHARHAGGRRHRAHVPALADRVAGLAAGRGEQRGGAPPRATARCATSRPRSPTRRGRWRWPAGARRAASCAGVRFRYPGAEREIAARGGPRRPARRDDGAGRRDRIGQDDADRARPAALRRDRRAGC